METSPQRTLSTNRKNAAWPSGAFVIDLGGGSQDGYLSELTARACGIPLYAGPTEGTALGNLAVQMIADGVFDSVADLRTNIAESFNVVEYHANEEQIE